jgi:hypothetical protein
MQLQLTDIQKITLLFLFGCIPVRLLFVWLAKNKQPWLPVMAVFATIIAIGFSVIYILKLRRTGAEVFGGVIWWNDLRPVHAFLYGLFAYLAIADPEHAWKPLAVDVSLGFTAFILHRVFSL